MASVKLDRTRDYGTIMGDTEGRAFEQDGKFFGPDGRLWRGDSQGKPDDGSKEPPTPVTPSGEGDQLSQQLGG